MSVVAKLHVLSGGAAHGLVGALTPRFAAETGHDIAGQFGAVGAIKEKLLSGAPADLLILTRQMIGDLERDGHVVPGSAVDIGVVHTGIAVRAGDPLPDIETPATLRFVLDAADALYFPDPSIATAGAHFSKVLAQLGLAEQLAGRIRTFPNGAAAMAALAAHIGGRPIGCTQATEIIGTPGTVLAGPLPPEHALTTIYTAAIARRAASPNAAQRFAAMLTGADAKPHREAAGFAA